MTNRHLARSIAMQSLFEWDFNGYAKDRLSKVIAENTAEFAPGVTDTTFIAQLAYGVAEKKTTLDEIIEKAAPEWPLDKIALVDRNVLRLGLFELLFLDRKEVPAKVAINEAIELAKHLVENHRGSLLTVFWVQCTKSWVNRVKMRQAKRSEEWDETTQKISKKTNWTKCLCKNWLVGLCTQRRAGKFTLPWCMIYSDIGHSQRAR